MVSDPGISSTEVLYFAAHLCTTKQLTFLKCMPAVGKGIQFLFRDPLGEMEALYEEYSSGAVAPSIDLFSNLRFLRREMDGVTSRVTRVNSTTIPTSPTRKAAENDNESSS
jgi:hypothetical protein